MRKQSTTLNRLALAVPEQRHGLKLSRRALAECDRQHDARLRRRGEARRGTTAGGAGPARRHPVLGRARGSPSPRGRPARGRVPRGLWRRVRAPQASGRVHRGARRYAKKAQDWKRSTLALADERHGAGVFAVRLRTRNGVIPAKANNLVLVEFDGPRDELEAKLRDRAPAEPGGALAAWGARLPARARRLPRPASSRSPTAASPGRATAC